MKNYLILILALIVITSCKESKENKEEIIKENISNKIKQNFKDPDSFEFVSMNLKEKETVKERKKVNNEKKVEEVKELYEKLGSKDSKELLESMQKELEFLNKQTDDDKTAVFKYDFVAKGTNSFGGKIQTKYLVRVLNDENYTVLSFSKND